MDNRNTREDINFSSNSDPINDVDTGRYLSDYEKNLKQSEKSVNDWERSKRVEEERNARYERVRKQCDDIISSITESDDLKKNLEKKVFSPPASLFIMSIVDECVGRIRGLLNNEWKDDFLRYFEKNYWKKEVDSNLKIQRGGAKPLTEGIMEDTVLLAFYYFLLEITIESFRESGETLIKKRELSISPTLEWITMTAIIQTLFEKYENILSPLIKRDSCYFLGKQADRDLIEKNAHEWLGINMIRPWKIDPKFRCFDTEKLYTLFERVQKIEPKKGRPSEGIELRKSLVGEVMLKAQRLFNQNMHLIYKKAGFKERKREGLFGACVYITAIREWGAIYPVKPLKYWAEFFNVSEDTFRRRLNDLKEFYPTLKGKIE